MLDLLFLNPPIWHRSGVHYRLNRGLAGPIFCAILKANGLKSKYLDAEALQYFPQQTAAIAAQMRPRNIAMTVLNHNKASVLEMITLLRQNWHGRILLGGPAVTAEPEAFADVADAYCIGEGEEVILDMLQDNGRFSPLWWSIDRIPIPDLDSCEPTDSYYVGNEPRFEHPEGISIWVRGCPHQCLFCSHPIFGGYKPRYMSPERVREEMAYLKKRGCRHVFVYADELVGSSLRQDSWLREVCHSIAPLKLTYKTQGRCHPKLTLETLQAMKESGFRAVMWGIESLSDKVLTLVHKGITAADAFRTLELSHKAGLKNWGFFMVAGIGETEADFNLTLKGVKEMRALGILDFGQVSIMTLEPGAPYYETAAKEGWLPAEAPRHSHFSGYANYPWANPEEQERRRNLLAEALSA